MSLSIKQIALAAAIVTSTFSANAQSSVTLYGNVDLSLNHYSSSGDSKTSLDSGKYKASVFGVRGSEDLGQGLKVQFNLEHGFNADTGTQSETSTWGREAYLGLQSDTLGTVRFGLDKTPVRKLLDRIDPFEGALLQNTLGGGNVYSRMSNSIGYQSPVFSGFSVEGAYGFGENSRSNSADRFMGLGAQYQWKDLSVHFALNDKNNATGLSTRDTTLGAIYDAKIVKLHAALSERSVEGLSKNEHTYFLGATVPVTGNSRISGTFTRHDFNQGAQNISNQFALGYFYDPSKRTTFYGRYTHQSNDANVSLNASSNGASADTVTLGMKHSF